MKKIIAFLISLVLVITVMPVTTLQANQQITERKQLKGSNYTNSTKLAKQLNDVFKGKIGLYSGGSGVLAPVGSSKMTDNNMFSIKNKTTGEVKAGWQCYIYANAVYNTLFGECVMHGDNLSHSKKVMSKAGSTLSYKKCKKAGVRCGAYLRVASDYSGCYNGNNGHSLIILSYDREGISYLEGNSDNHGLVSVTESTWEEFNYTILTRLSRKVCYIIQPAKSYYDTLYYKPGKVQLSKIKETDSNQVTLEWEKVADIKGYQLKYSTSKKFEENTDTKKVKSSAKGRTISSLDHGETYYFKIRAYNKNEKKNIYGKWSKVRKVTIVEEDDIEEIQENTELENTGQKKEIVAPPEQGTRRDEKTTDWMKEAQ